MPSQSLAFINHEASKKERKKEVLLHQDCGSEWKWCIWLHHTSKTSLEVSPSPKERMVKHHCRSPLVEKENKTNSKISSKWNQRVSFLYHLVEEACSSWQPIFLQSSLQWTKGWDRFPPYCLHLSDSLKSMDMREERGGGGGGSWWSYVQHWQTW